MKLARLPCQPSLLIDFFEEGLETLGAVCERPWHDRLRLIAEDRAARLWDRDGGLVERELRFPPPDQTAPREAESEIFPGCPLTFRLAEALRSPALTLERLAFGPAGQVGPAAPEVAERLWHAQHPGYIRWQASPFLLDWHFSLLCLMRCEIQAIDQHWSLHRLALALPAGGADEALAEQLEFLDPIPEANPPWPQGDPEAWQRMLVQALNLELDAELASIRERQQKYLERELERIDSYFEGYEKELKQRQDRAGNRQGRLKFEERLAAAKAEHARRRQDQLQRHEIRIIPHLDALMLLAEPAWKTTLYLARAHEPAETREAWFIPRTRTWA